MNGTKWGLSGLTVAAACITCCGGLDAKEESLSKNGDPPEVDAKRGTIRHYIESEFTSGKNRVEVLLPDNYDKAKKYRVLYFLPVEAKDGAVFGDGMMEAKKCDIHNKYDVICAYPLFDTVPWYGNHSDNPRIRHEDYLVKSVVPFVEKTYSTRGDREGRLLVGYSKSGWGAFILLMRNPEFFGYAAAWDAPLMLDVKQLGVFGTKDNYGTEENFSSYLPTRLAAENAGKFGGRPRFVLAGEKFFGRMELKSGDSHTKMFHELLEKNGIKHLYNDKIPKEHNWNSGWVPEVVEMLMSLTSEQK